MGTGIVREKFERGEGPRSCPTALLRPVTLRGPRPLAALQDHRPPVSVVLCPPPPPPASSPCFSRSRNPPLSSRTPLCLSWARTLLSPLFEAPSVSPTIPAHDSALPSPQNAPLASGFSLLPRFPSAHTHTHPPQSRFWCWSPGSRGQRGRWTRTREGEPCGCPVLEKHTAGDLRSRLVSRPWDSCCNGTRRLGGRGEPAQRHSHRAQGAAALGGEGERVPDGRWTRPPQRSCLCTRGSGPPLGTGSPQGQERMAFALAATTPEIPPTPWPFPKETLKGPRAGRPPCAPASQPGPGSSRLFPGGMSPTFLRRPQGFSPRRGGGPRAWGSASLETPPGPSQSSCIERRLQATEERLSPPLRPVSSAPSPCLAPSLPSCAPGSLSLHDFHS